LRWIASDKAVRNAIPEYLTTNLKQSPRELYRTAPLNPADGAQERRRFN
jgi:hypothetical protein